MISYLQKHMSIVYFYPYSDTTSSQWNQLEEDCQSPTKISMIGITVFIRNIRTPLLLAILFRQSVKISILLPVDVYKTAGWVASSVDPDQMPQNAASDLGLHCLLRPVCPNT